MPVKEKEEGYKKYLAYAKDAIYIISIIAGVIGWLSAKSKNEAILETTLKYNTEAIKKMELFMDNQKELNGKVIQYIEMDMNDK